ncbi:amidohydrolase family protein [Oharaeibacter diazotrophicus]|uniref:Cytosine deaminase n=1 Tax=Oharaeibacter diazotrophicus TaxID=1920512 RepID=A0A4R6R8N5_9HYPH|nr:amidohydrolase family protein [Oharaeibacter diazotrophicus]TDP82393.1 cytosine deaminase [Oharaeibacter diazotrophicus]BBE72844.1 cytosine deaminase [Pleomorphomonas sp. SM30]GLS76883.1 cytosine deaminase [Oharaeibacter diazotrophicus]
MVDLLVKNANLPDGRSGVDVAIDGGRIVGIGPGIDAEAGRVIDATGRLVSPPFVDPHFHMDATLSLGIPRLNRSGTLLEGIALWGELKPLLTVEAVAERALRYCDLAVAQGLLAIRTHVDVCDDRLTAVEALLDVKRRIAPYIDLQLVAFPQDGLYRSAGAERNLLRALDMGVDVVGGIPHFERTMEDGARSVRRSCEIAAERGLPVDLHCDETDDPMSRHVETLAAETVRLGLQGRVVGSHLTSMHSMDNYYVSKLIPLIGEAGLHAVPNPLINITLQGRHDSYPKRRGMTRVPELMAAGVNVALGQDCCMDPWYSLGSGDMLEVAHMAVHVAPMTSRDGMRSLFDAVTVNSARALGLAGYGLEVGAHGDLVVLQARDPIEAIRTKATRLTVVRRGKVIAETPEKRPKLFLDGRPDAIDPAAYAPPLD